VTNQQPVEDERLVGAVDLGSNSFHVTIAKLTASGLQIVMRDRERVRLASGLNQSNELDEDAIQRGLDALKRFNARLSTIAATDIRVVGTHTLREATNANTFIDRAADCFRAPIEVISGPEEARLIFHAVAHTQPVDGPFMVFDIGGGSTEFAIGQNYDPLFLSSRTLGCVTYTNQYMKSVNKASFAEVELATQRAIEPIVNRIKAFPFETCFATSGTAKGVSALGDYLGFGPRITADSINACKKFLAKDSNRKITTIPNVSVERMQVLPAGVGILSAILSELDLTEIVFADAALREGVLYTMDDRLKADDIRERTAFNLVNQYGIDRDQAERIRITSEGLFDALESPWNLSEEDRHMLIWGAMLHEIGLQINYSGFHRHGAYILGNTPLPGFNREQQDVLATLVRLHRKRLDLAAIPQLRHWSKDRIVKLIRILRIATVMRIGRHDKPRPEYQVKSDGEVLQLRFDANALKHHPVMTLDLQDEVKRQADAGLRLELVS
jgi:exopolyphosphatase/guanosine-5'-triphosphate,3'-diphosphate pyrophosphatase